MDVVLLLTLLLLAEESILERPHGGSGKLLKENSLLDGEVARPSSKVTGGGDAGRLEAASEIVAASNSFNAAIDLSSSSCCRKSPEMPEDRGVLSKYVRGSSSS